MASTSSLKHEKKESCRDDRPIFYMVVDYDSYIPDWDDEQCLESIGIETRKDLNKQKAWDVFVKKTGYDPIDKVIEVLDRAVPDYFAYGEHGVESYRPLSGERARKAVRALYESEYFEEQSLYIEASIGLELIAQMDVAGDGYVFISEIMSAYKKGSDYVSINKIKGESNMVRVVRDIYHHVIPYPGNYDADIEVAEEGMSLKPIKVRVLPGLTFKAPGIKGEVSESCGNVYGLVININGVNLYFGKDGSYDGWGM